MSTATVKGFIPAQMEPINTHRPYHVRAVGLTFWCKMQIVAAVLLGVGATTVGVCMIWAMATATVVSQ